MLLALGTIDAAPLIEGAILMAKDQIRIHERNKDELGTFQHKDGWGMAYLTPKKIWTIYKSTLPIYEDPNTPLLKSIHTSALLIHVRRALTGKICKENTHPFSATLPSSEEYLFCHNGTIHDTIFFSSEFHPFGTTDTEQLLYSILTDAQKKPTILASIQDNLARYKDYTGINTIFLTSTQSIITLKAKITPQYFSMSYLQNAQQLIISSDPLPTIPKAQWKTLTPGRIIHINNASRVLREYPL